MSLLRLLTTGKSLEGLKDSENRYRVTRQRYLPQFGPAKNPFCATVRPDPAIPDVCRATEGASGPSQRRPARVAHLPARVGLEPPGVAASDSRTALVKSSRSGLASEVRSRVAAFRNTWAGKLSSVLSRSGGKPVRVAMSRPPKLPVQGELSLDKIRVVRNDLSDADLEVVPAKLPVAPKAVASVLGAVERAGAGGTAWERWSGFFRTGKA